MPRINSGFNPDHEQILVKYKDYKITCQYDSEPNVTWNDIYNLLKNIEDKIEG